MYKEQRETGLIPLPEVERKNKRYILFPVFYFLFPAFYSFLFKLIPPEWKKSQKNPALPHKYRDCFTSSAMISHGITLIAREERPKQSKKLYQISNTKIPSPSFFFLFILLFISFNVFSQDWDSCMFHGGVSNGPERYGLLSPAACTPSYIAVSKGGNADGHVKDTTGCTAVTPICSVNPNAGTDVTLCQGDTAQMQASGGLTYSWSPTTGLSNPDIANPRAFPTTTTSYTVTIADLVCSQTDVVVVTVTSASAPSISGTDTICNGESTTLTASGGTLSYQWSTGATTAAVNLSPTSTTGYWVIITDAGGCSKLDTTVTVNPLPAASTGGNQTICNGGNTTIGAAAVGGNTYSWSPATGLSSATVSNPTASPTTTTTYTLTETITATGCQKSNSVTVTVNPLPAANAGSNDTICGTGSVSIGAATVGGNTYSWSPATGLSSTTVSNPTASPTTTTTYTLTETITATGCQKSNSVIVSVGPAVVIEASGGGYMCVGDSVTLLATGGGTTYLWNPGGGTTQSIIVKPAVTTVYTVTVDGLCLDDATVTVVSPCTYTAVSKGGSADGNAVNTVNYTICSSDVAYFGGQAGGQVVSTITPATCTPVYAAVSKGGNADGHALGSKEYVTCVIPQYLGGDAGGQVVSTITPATCTPVYVAASKGGNADGHALGSKEYITCVVPQYLGGDAGGQVTSTITPANCGPLYASVSKGSTADGHSWGGVAYTMCNQDILYFGGDAGGQVTSTITPANCTPVYTSVSKGSAAGGDGHGLYTTPMCYTALPIELLSFTASPKNNKEVLCEWETASEINNDFFTVEKTTDVKNFVVVDKVDGAGNSTSTLSYSLIDKKPFMGTSYYRLKQTDYDGKYNYSQLVPVHIGETVKGIRVNLYPNPVTETLTVFLTAETELSLLVVITDVLGRKVYDARENIEKGNTQFFINTNEYSEGVYFVNIVNTSINQSIALKRLVKIGR